MFDVEVKQSMDVKDFCETCWEGIFDSIVENDIHDYILANFGADSLIMDVFIDTDSDTYMPEILEELLKIAKKRKEELC